MDIPGGAGGYRAQSALEYLTTYGWAIIVLAIVLGALYALGVFNPSSTVSTTCTFPGEFGCISAILFSINSTLAINIQQATPSNINVTAIGCNNQGIIANVLPVNQITTPAVNQITLGIGSNYTFYVPCYQNGTLVSIQSGQLYRGYVLLNYTTLTTSFPHTVSGTLVAKAT